MIWNNVALYGGLLFFFTGIFTLIRFQHTQAQPLEYYGLFLFTLGVILLGLASLDYWRQKKEAEIR